jgi:hypothetical protein
MDTFIYTRLSLQLLSQIVNVWVNALLSQRTMKRISSQVHRLSEWYLFQASSCVMYATCWSIYL